MNDKRNHGINRIDINDITRNTFTYYYLSEVVYCNFECVMAIYCVYCYLKAHSNLQ